VEEFPFLVWLAILLQPFWKFFCPVRQG